jgi:predicted O-linked N-acetylglucosamine transferase (SPINDLY family)
MASNGPAERPDIQTQPEPGSAQVEALLARAIQLADAGRIPETAPLLDRILQLQPGTPAAVSGLLMTSLYDPSRTPQELARLHRAWCGTLEAKVPPDPAFPRDWDPGRPLTVGYLSADFREHSCAAFIEPLLRAHDRESHRINLYATLPRRDARTEVFRALADLWVEVEDLGDQALADRLRADGVDILVDLGGHSAFNRLTLLARRPVPVQLEWLGYPFTTGLTRLEGRITDSLVDPPGSEALASEPLLRLDPCYLCWQPPNPSPEPFSGPRSGPFTFGSFNHFAKLNPAVIQTWAAILRRTPDTRLLLKGKGSQDAILRERVLEGFQEEGVPPSRVLFAEWTPGITAHLEFYRQVDLALDPFPYNGVTTSLEALWMGVPLVSLLGPHSLSRQGLALLSQVGLEELAAETPAAYVSTAAALAGDPTRLGRCRQGLRGRLLASPLCDAPHFARRMEALYRRLWQDACRKALAES